MENKKNRFQSFLSRLKKSVTHNSVLKVISLIFAFVLWFAVVNYTNPEVLVTVKTTVEVRNDQELKKADRIYTLNDKSVNISYKVRTGNRTLVKPSDFKAYIDLADYSITGAVPVYVEVSNEASQYISDMSHDPLIVHISTENIIRKRFEVTGSIKGNASDGYVIGEIRHDPEVVYITGTASEISKIAGVSFVAEINGAREDVHGSEKILLTDAEGKKLNINAKIEPFEYADYTVKIYKTKSLTVKASVEGLPQDGYVVDSIETSPTFVSVYGEDSILNNTPCIFIPRYDINVEGISENKTFNLDINDYLPDGLYLNQGNSQLVVLVKIRSVMQLPEQKETAASVPVSTPEVKEVTEDTFGEETINSPENIISPEEDVVEIPEDGSSAAEVNTNSSDMTEEPEESEFHDDANGGTGENTNGI